MIITYYPHSKSIHNFKNMEFENSKTSKYLLNFLNFKSPFPHVIKWGVMCMTYKIKL